MIRLSLPVAVLALSTPAVAAERSFAFGSYDRVRVEGPFAVTIETGVSPGAVAAGDARALDRVDIAMQGTTLVVRAASGGWGETPVGRATAPATVTLRTPRLAALFVTGGGRVTVGAMRAQRVDVSLTGAGLVTAGAIDGDEVYATAVGAGSLTLAGRAGRARLIGSGSATIDASALTANDLVVLQNGTGETRAAARYSAQLRADGLGRIVVTGNAKCVVQKGSVGPVECGTGQGD